MADGSLARRYARALASLAEEQGCVERIAADLALFSDTLALGDGQLGAAMGNPGLTQGERKGLLNAVLARSEFHETSQNFLRLLVDKNRFVVFSDIRRAYIQMADDLAGRIGAKVTSATPLSDAMAERVRSALDAATGKQVVIDFEVDAGLIGGVVAQVGDKIYDASVRARLDEIQQNLFRNPEATAGDA